MRKKSRRKGVRRRTSLPGTARRPTRSARVVSPAHLIAALEEELERLRDERSQLSKRIEVNFTLAGQEGENVPLMFF